MDYSMASDITYDPWSYICPVSVCPVNVTLTLYSGSLLKGSVFTLTQLLFLPNHVIAGRHGQFLRNALIDFPAALFSLFLITNPLLSPFFLPLSLCRLISDSTKEHFYTKSATSIWDRPCM